MQANQKHNEEYTIIRHKVATLSEAEIHVVISQIRSIYTWFSPTSPDGDIAKRLHQHPQAYIDMLIHTRTGECRGFSIYYTERFLGYRVIYRGGTIVSDRSKGLYKKLLRNSISVLEHDFVVAMTQNPRVYETLSSFSPGGKVYPSPEVSVSEELQLIASHFCKIPSIDLQTLIVPDVYSSIRKEGSFKSVNNARTEHFFKAHLKENDGFFVIVPLH